MLKLSSPYALAYGSSVRSCGPVDHMRFSSVCAGPPGADGRCLRDAHQLENGGRRVGTYAHRLKTPLALTHAMHVKGLPKEGQRMMDSCWRAGAAHSCFTTLRPLELRRPSRG